MSFRVIVTYPGYNAELEEELYFATRRRPDQVGQTLVKPPVPADMPTEGRIHFPELVDQHHRFLSYNAKSSAEADHLAAKFASIEGVCKVNVIDDTPAPAAEEAATGGEEAPAAEEPGPAEDAPVAHVATDAPAADAPPAAAPAEEKPADAQ